MNLNLITFYYSVSHNGQFHETETEIQRDREIQRRRQKKRQTDGDRETETETDRDRDSKNKLINCNSCSQINIKSHATCDYVTVRSRAEINAIKVINNNNNNNIPL